LLQFGHLFAKAPTREAAIRAMVVALRDVRVRGEIHTIIDYAADMLQSPEFVDNTIHTGWLDSRIAANVRAERPPWHLCVIGAAAVRAHEAFACKAAEYLGFLAKGQLPPHDVSLIYFEVGGRMRIAVCTARAAAVQLHGPAFACMLPCCSHLLGAPLPVCKLAAAHLVLLLCCACLVLYHSAGQHGD
jgi:hypothetical protein